MEFLGGGEAVLAGRNCGDEIRLGNHVQYMGKPVSYVPSKINLLPPGSVWVTREEWMKLGSRRPRKLVPQHPSETRSQYPVAALRVILKALEEISALLHLGMPSRFKSETEIRVDDFYEDCAFHLCLCIAVGDEHKRDAVRDIALVNGSIRGCSAKHCGLLLLSVEEALAWKLGGPTDRILNEYCRH